jgi:hypothetical protein
MRIAVRTSTLHGDETLLIGLTGLVLVAGLTLGGGTRLAYLVVALPVVLGVTWSRPAYGFALLLSVVLLTEEFEIPTLASGIDPWLLQTLPMMYFFGRLVAEGAWTYRHVADPLLRVVAAAVPLAIVNQLVASSFEMQLTYTRNMMYLGTLIGLLGPIQRLSALGAATRSSLHRWRLLRGLD